MTWIPLRERFDQLPLVIAGPILRRVEPNSVTVWLALKESRTVTLAVLDMNKKVLFSGQQKTRQIGINLHIVAVTATSQNNTLLYGENYLYNLAFNPGETLSKLGVLNYLGAITDIIYPPYDLPSFAMVPNNINDLRIVYGSCRKPHGESMDALAGLDKMIKEALMRDPKMRPHQLFLTGDQIYADDVADALLFMLMDASSTLLGWSEKLPDVVNTEDLKPGKRNNIATQTAGLTASLDKFNKVTNIAKSHLLTFGEFLMMYLFVWSDVLWCNFEEFPTFDDINSNPVNRSAEEKLFNKEVIYLKDLWITLKEVRRALANVPSYMIFDDHEVTDDWYLNMAWCERVLSKPLGKRVLQNGLLAYAICQGWGNTPEQFEIGKPGDELLKAVEAWGANDGNSSVYEYKISLRLGLPSLTQLKDSNPRELISNEYALKWSYTINAPDYEVLVLDTRTRRGFPGEYFDFPALLSEKACEEQISQVARPNNTKVTLIISPSPVIGLPFIEGIQKTAKVFTDAMSTAAWGFDPEAWGLQETASERFIAQLALRGLSAENNCVVVLSGDVHYSFTARLQYSATCPFGNTENIPTKFVLAQFTCSSFKNEVSGFGGSHSLHSKGFIPFKFVNHIPSSEILGWSNPGESELDIGNIYTILDHNMECTPWKLKGKNPVTINLAQERSLFKELEIIKKPEWCYSVKFLLAQSDEIHNTNTEIAHHVKSNTVIAPLPGEKRKPYLKQYLAMAKNHRDYLFGRGEGKEVVGLNNIGEISFNFNEGKAIATQTLWWRLKSWDGKLLEPFPLTRTEVSLLFDEKYTT